MGRPADDHERRRELPRVRRRRTRAGDDAGLPSAGGAVRNRVRQRRRHARRLLGTPVPRLRRRRRVPRRDGHRGDRGERAPARARFRARAARLRRHVLRDVRRRLLPRPRGGRRRRRRLGHGGGALPHALRLEGDDRAPPGRVPRLEDHGGPGAREREDRVRHAVRRRGGARRRESEDVGRPPAPRRDGRAARSGGGRPLRRHRPRPEHGALPRLDRPRRRGLPGHRGRARPRRTSTVSSPPATCRITSIGRPSRRRAPGAWRRSTRSGSSPSRKATSSTR